MISCIFCQIVAGKIPADKVYEDEEILAFRDIHAAAPTHVLIIPKQHIPSLMELTDVTLAGKILLGVQKVAKQLELDKHGFRVVNNMGQDGGQTVHHIHFHLLGGRTLTWPPG